MEFQNQQFAIVFLNSNDLLCAFHFINFNESIEFKVLCAPSNFYFPLNSYFLSTKIESQSKLSFDFLLISSNQSEYFIIEILKNQQNNFEFQKKQITEFKFLNQQSCLDVENFWMNPFQTKGLLVPSQFNAKNKTMDCRVTQFEYWQSVSEFEVVQYDVQLEIKNNSCQILYQKKLNNKTKTTVPQTTNNNIKKLIKTGTNPDENSKLLESDIYYRYLNAEFDKKSYTYCYFGYYSILTILGLVFMRYEDDIDDKNLRTAITVFFFLFSPIVFGLAYYTHYKLVTQPKEMYLRQKLSEFKTTISTSEIDIELSSVSLFPPSEIEIIFTKIDSLLKEKPEIEMSPSFFLEDEDDDWEKARTLTHLFLERDYRYLIKFLNSHDPTHPSDLIDDLRKNLYEISKSIWRNKQLKWGSLDKFHSLFYKAYLNSNGDVQFIQTLYERVKENIKFSNFMMDRYLEISIKLPPKTQYGTDPETYTHYLNFLKLSFPRLWKGSLNVI